MSAHSPYLTNGNSTNPPAKKQKTEHFSAVSDIDESMPGDVTMKVGEDDNTIELRVHSSVLKLASPVFRTMLSAEWKEGLKSHTEFDPLPLPDDDPVAFLLFCRLLHYKVDPRYKLSMAELRGVAILVDKYDCYRVLQPWLRPRIEQFINHVSKGGNIKEGEGELNMHDAMCVAYLFRDSTLFWEATKHVITYSKTADLSESIDPKLLEIMPTNFLEHIHSLTMDEINRLDNETMSRVKRIYCRVQPGTQLCQGNVKATAQYHLKLPEARTIPSDSNKLALRSRQSTTD